MATKLFLRNTTVSGVTDTGDGVVYDLSKTAGAGADTDVVTLVADGTNIQWTQTEGGATVAWISQPFASGVTLTTCDFSGWFQESNANDNTGGRFRIYKYTPGTPTITELTGSPFDDGVEFDSMAATEMAWVGNFTDVAFAAGDRILLRLFATNVGTMTAGTATLTFNAADASTGDTFLNINETIAFSSPSSSTSASISPSPSSSVSSSASSSVSSSASSSQSPSSSISLSPSSSVSSSVSLSPSSSVSSSISLSPSSSQSPSSSISPSPSSSPSPSAVEVNLQTDLWSVTGSSPSSSASSSESASPSSSQSPSSSVSASISSSPSSSQSPSSSVSSSISPSPSSSQSPSSSTSLSESPSPSPSGSAGRLNYWNGSAWIQKDFNVFNGSTFVSKPTKYWDGMQWL